MQEALQLINQMQADGLIGKYAIGGAVGAAFYLDPTSSLDIDIFVSFGSSMEKSLTPLRPVYQYLMSHGATPVGEHLLVKNWLIQFLPAEDVLLREALDAATEIEIRGVKTQVMTAEHLIALALRLGRSKDQVRVERFIELGAYDPEKLEPILKKHQLVERWQRAVEKFRNTR